jgi:hypothetical protein
MLGSVNAAADESKALAIEHHQTGARPIRELFEGSHWRMARSE